MKKLVSTAAVLAAITFAPTGASAHSWKHHHSYNHEGAAIVVVGAGAGAGAIVAGPVGAVVGGAAALFLVVVHGGVN